jgi:hypothetical protein
MMTPEQESRVGHYLDLLKQSDPTKSGGSLWVTPDGWREAVSILLGMIHHLDDENNMLRRKLGMETEWTPETESSDLLPS